MFTIQVQNFVSAGGPLRQACRFMPASVIQQLCYCMSYHESLASLGFPRNTESQPSGSPTESNARTSYLYSSSFYVRYLLLVNLQFHMVKQIVYTIQAAGSGLCKCWRGYSELCCFVLGIYCPSFGIVVVNHVAIVTYIEYRTLTS